MKTVVGLFFLSILITLPASAAEVAFHVSSDYKVAQVASLGKVTAFTLGEDGSFIVSENIGSSFRVSKVNPDNTTTVLLDHTSQAISNLSYYQGVVYLVSRGGIYKIAKGKISDVITGLPTSGDYGNSNLVFINDAMYFVVGTATNSGVVGPDNSWLASNPSVHDLVCSNVKLSGVNVETDNYLTEKKDDKAISGSFATFNTPVSAGQTVYGMNKCNGGLIKASLNGSMREVYAWGLHNPKGLSVDDAGRLWVFDGGMEDRGVRPIKDGKDAFYEVKQNTWYGWPDFNAGMPVGQSAIFAEIPNNPPQPQETFGLNQIKYLLISPKKFQVNSAVAQTADDKLMELNLTSKSLQDFISVTDGKILQYKFGSDDKLYVLVSTGKDKTAIYSVEPTNSTASGLVGSTKSGGVGNWMLGLSLAVISGGSVFAFRNFRYPIKPL